ncbi:ribonuclease H1 [Obelidium mucronatum]|nr:ribonuclease H1 [Obelidium mucronatum]
MSFLNKILVSLKLMPKVYAVRVGRKPGLYKTCCQTQVHQFPGSEFKSFATTLEAEAYLKAESTSSKGSKRIRQEESEPNNAEQPAAAKKQRITTTVSIRPLSGILPPSSTKVIALPTTATPIPNNDAQAIQGITPRLVIYTDGACGGNGKASAKGGIGVFFAPNDPRNISEPLPGDIQTNNRAELLAVIRALQAAPENAHLTIKTDSKYVKNGIGGWVSMWKLKDWRNSKNEPVANKDLWLQLDDEMHKRHRNGVKTVHIEYIKAHAGLYGNEQADFLAVQGARMIAKESNI